MKYCFDVKDVYGRPLEELKPPAGFEFTGEFYPPKTGEKYLAPRGGYWAEAIDTFEMPRLLLKRIPTVEQIYGAPREELLVPSGYRLGEFERVVAGREYLNCWAATKQPALVMSYSRGVEDYWRIRLHKVAPTFKEVYGVDWANDLKIPGGFVSTGGFRPANAGEWMLLKDGRAYQAVIDERESCPRLILRPVTIKDVYGTDTPPIPEGWKMKEFRRIAPEEKVDFLAERGVQLHNPEEKVFQGNCGGWRIILERDIDLGAQTVTLSVRDVYGCIPEIPAGWEYVAFRLPLQEEYFIPATSTRTPTYCSHTSFVRGPRIILKEKK